MNHRFEYLDVLKAVAIIAVVFYHVGYMRYGYLGVDIFLVVNGFLLLRAFRELSTLNGGGKFIIKRILRLYPLTLFVTGVCLLWGSYWMLPYQYQDLAQSVIATDLFANNILMGIKSSNYWNVLNDYKPLMHTWYLGVIVQFYIAFALLFIFLKKLIRTKRDITIYIVGGSLVLSLMLYLLPNFNASQKFYFLPFRIFEFCAGCLTAYWCKDKEYDVLASKGAMSAVAAVSYILLFCLLFINADYASAPAKLLSTVVLTCVLLAALPHVNPYMDRLVSAKWLAVVGKACFSIYIWHQIVFAFCRYSFTSVFDAKVFLVTLSIIAVLSFLSYRYVEQGVASYLRKRHGERNVLAGCTLAATALIGISFYLNSCCGVVRDVPELDTYVGKTSDRMHIAYNERPYAWDKEFATNKQHWLVLGDSYGRDWANILSESGIEEKVELSYVYTTTISLKDRIERVKAADAIFLTITEINVAADVAFIDRRVSDMLRFCDSIGIDKNKMYVVGSKRFGQCIGQIYAQRNKPEYLSLSAHLEKVYFEHNDLMREKYEGRYIDMLAPVRTGEESVRVFSDDKKVISQDTEHLTLGGAKFYAKIFDTLISDLVEKHSKKSQIR